MYKAGGNVERSGELQVHSLAPSCSRVIGVRMGFLGRTLSS